jgi:acylphosphatase
MIRRRVVVHGRVQGVFFRDTVRRRAEQRGVGGWVRNRPDGALEAVFEGPEDEVESMIRFCRQGPRGADVERVEVSEGTPEGLREFRIEPTGA